MSEPVKYTPEEIAEIRAVLAGPLAFMMLDDGQQHVTHARWLATVDTLTRERDEAVKALEDYRAALDSAHARIDRLTASDIGAPASVRDTSARAEENAEFRASGTPHGERQELRNDSIGSEPKQHPTRIDGGDAGAPPSVGVPVWYVQSKIGTTHFFQSRPRAIETARGSAIVRHVAFLGTRADALLAAEARCEALTRDLASARTALAEAREAMRERRGYCPQWEWKYGEAWDDEDGKVDAALKGAP